MKNKGGKTKENVEKDTNKKSKKIRNRQGLEERQEKLVSNDF